MNPRSTFPQVTPRELIDWCAARLAHYKVPAAVHILPKMPTTGSGKILKTELRKMFGGAPTAGGATPATAAPGAPAAGPAAPEPAGVAAVDASIFGPEGVAALASPRAHAATVPLAEAAAVLAAACGGTIACQALDAGLGNEWGRELLPGLTYLLAVERAADIQAQASAPSLGRAMARLGGLLLWSARSMRIQLTGCALATVSCRLRQPYEARGCATWRLSPCSALPSTTLLAWLP